MIFNLHSNELRAVSRSKASRRRAFLSSASSFALGGLLMATATCGQAAASSIDTLSTWDGTSYVWSWGAYGTPTYGQTFTPVAGQTTLQSFTFVLSDLNGGAQNFIAQIYQWNGSTVVGTALFTSATLAAPTTTAFTPVTITTSGVTLTPGVQYVALFTTIGLGGTGEYSWGGITTAGAYSGGSYVYTNDSASITSTWDGTYPYCGDCQTAFNITFGPSGTNIDTAAAFYNSSALGSTLFPVFQGGTLKIDQANQTYSQSFSLDQSLTNTIDQNGQTSTFSGAFSNATPGAPGNLTIVNSGSGGVLTFTGAIGAGDPIGTFTNAGDTTIGGGGSLNAISVVNSGTFTIDAGATVTDGSLTNTGSASNSGAIQGSVTNNGGIFTNTASGTVSGLVTNAGGVTLNAGVLNGGALVSGGLLASMGTINGSVTNNATVDAVGVINGAVVNNGVLNVGALGATGGNLQVSSLTNAGTVNMATATSNLNVKGAYYGAPGSQLQLGVNFAAGTADKLTVGSVSGSSQIVLNSIGSNLVAAYNPTGIVLVSSANPMNPNSFTLANGSIQKGLFAYDLAYDADPAFVLVSVPTADAYRLATVPTAAQSIFFDTAAVWSDRQANLRDMIAGSFTPAPGTKVVKGPAESGQPVTAPGLWAAAVGDWANRSQTQTYGVLNQTYAYQTGYQQNTGAIFGGLDGTLHNVFGARDTLLLGVLGGYVNSTQDFKGTTARATYEGGSLGVSATYLKDAWFADALLKADFLNLHYSDANVAAFGPSSASTNIAIYGGLIDAGYRFEFLQSFLPGKSFIEPMATLAYAATDAGGLSIGGSQVAFGGDDVLRGRIALRGGSTLVETSAYHIDGVLTAGYWGYMSGSSTAIINSGATAPLLTLTDRRVTNYGDVGLNFNYIRLRGDWTGFVKGDYQFASGFNAGSVKGGVSYTF